MRNLHSQVAETIGIALDAVAEGRIDIAIRAIASVSNRIKYGTLDNLRAQAFLDACEQYCEDAVRSHLLADLLPELLRSELDYYVILAGHDAHTSDGIAACERVQRARLYHKAIMKPFEVK